jgi:hypothetical protein
VVVGVHSKTPWDHHWEGHRSADRGYVCPACSILDCLIKLALNGHMHLVEPPPILIFFFQRDGDEVPWRRRNGSSPVACLPAMLLADQLSSVCGRRRRGVRRGRACSYRDREQRRPRAFPAPHPTTHERSGGGATPPRRPRRGCMLGRGRPRTHRPITFLPERQGRGGGESKFTKAALRRPTT